MTLEMSHHKFGYQIRNNLLQSHSIGYVISIRFIVVPDEILPKATVTLHGHQCDVAVPGKFQLRRYFSFHLAEHKQNCVSYD